MFILMMMHWVSCLVYSNGDARVALNAIELAVLTTKPARDGSVHVDLDVVEDWYTEETSQLR